jgi:1,4-alpha-glucan branching enzyme
MQASDLLSEVPKKDIERLVSLEYHDPHFILGGHPLGNGSSIIRSFHPEAMESELVIEGRSLPMKRVHPRGIFAIKVNMSWPFDYRLRFYSSSGKSWERRDPYRFLPTLGEMDLHLIGEGRHLHLYRIMGAHPRTISGIKGVSFALWAPNALRVSLIGDFNQWDGRIYPMRVLGNSGVWEIFVPDLEAGAIYKYEIKTKKGDLRIKSDPFAFFMEMRPRNASIIWDLNEYRWKDNEWLEKKDKDHRKEPMNIYEAHLGSWMRIPEEGKRWLTYSEIAPKLVKHIKEYGFTHVELMPIMEHPLDDSWGYQTTGYYAPTSRYGTPDEFKFFVDNCHQNNIGVILDWAPAHFPKDDFALRLFDGTGLYEYVDSHLREHPDWGTLIFNFGRNEVRNFLIAGALFWLDIYHVDGIRTDAVASMLYLDYGRKEGEWVANKYGGRENLEAVNFIRQLNEDVYARFPRCFTVAEESTSWPGVSLPTYLGGLGFGFKWNMGWMNDTLSYFSKDPIHRKWHHNELTFSMLYAYSENFTLPLSHDEVVHEKGSLLSKMPGDYWQKFANLRAFLSYMYTHPGKKLLFMGTELASDNEWNVNTSLDWHLLESPDRQDFSRFLKDLGSIYLREKSLWQEDADPIGFSWIDCNDSEHSVFSYLRRATDGDYLICIFNFTPTPCFDYRIGVPQKITYREMLNTDSVYYGGSNLGNGEYVEAGDIPWYSFPFSISITLPPLACLILKPERI